MRCACPFKRRADDATARIADREHDAVAKRVVAAPLLVYFDESRFDEALEPARGSAEPAHERVPGIGCIAQAEA